jgi:hypothetical protein
MSWRDKSKDEGGRMKDESGRMNVEGWKEVTSKGDE